MSPSRSKSAGASCSAPGSTPSASDTPVGSEAPLGSETPAVSETSVGSGEEVCTSVIGLKPSLLSCLLLGPRLADGLNTLGHLLLRLLFDGQYGRTVRLHQLALLGEASLASLRRVRPGRRHVADDEELLTHGPQ